MTKPTDFVCTVDDCALPVHILARQLCRFHYGQFLRGKKFTSSSAPNSRRRDVSVCMAKTCDRPGTAAAGYCSTHYWRFKTGRDLDAPIKNQINASLVRDNQGRKECRHCGKWQSEDHFGYRRNPLDNRSSSCKTCVNRRLARSRNAPAGRDTYLRRMYGITLAQFEAMLESQGMSCKLCGTDDPGKKAWHVDHDHSCCSKRTSCGSCVRGILCAGCNTALGAFNDSVEKLRKAIDYLQANSVPMVN